MEYLGSTSVLLFGKNADSCLLISSLYRVAIPFHRRRQRCGFPIMKAVVFKMRVRAYHPAQVCNTHKIYQQENLMKFLGFVYLINPQYGAYLNNTMTIYFFHSLPT